MSGARKPSSALRAESRDTAPAVGSSRPTGDLACASPSTADATGDSPPLVGGARRPKRKRPEDAIQRAIVQALRLSRLPGVIFFAVPNGGVRSHIESAIMVGLGTRAGIADLCIVARGGRAHFIEVKSPRGRLSPEQRQFEDDCRRCDVPHAVVTSLDEAIAVLDGWGLTRARIMAGGHG